MNIPTLEEAQKIVKEAAGEICSTCQKCYFSPEEKEFIRKVGECSFCDHIRSDMDGHDCHASSEDGCECGKYKGEI